MCTLLVCKFTKNLANSEKINEKIWGKLGKLGGLRTLGGLGVLGTLGGLGTLRVLGRQGTPLIIFINSQLSILN